jgi:hypothetical protein
MVMMRCRAPSESSSYTTSKPREDSTPAQVLAKRGVVIDQQYPPVVLLTTAGSHEAPQRPPSR